MEGNGNKRSTRDVPGAEAEYYTARHLLAALQSLEDPYLDLPLVLVHGKELQKPNLIRGLIPAPTPVSRAAVEAKPPSLLTLGHLIDDEPTAEDAPTVASRDSTDDPSPAA